MNEIVSECKRLVVNSIPTYASDFFFIDTLYPAHSRAGRLVIFYKKKGSRHLLCWEAKFNAAFCLNTKVRKWTFKIFQYIEWESNPHPVTFTVRYTLVPLRYDWPQKYLIYTYLLQHNIKIFFFCFYDMAYLKVG